MVIVGAGPAGMAAAVALCEAGLKPTVIDENPRTGGQIYRQLPASFREHTSAMGSSASQNGIDLRRAFHHFDDQVELLTNTTVWGFFPPHGLATSSDDGWQMTNARRCLLATGASEYVPPFPGWTLPGVMTPGGAQSLVKSMRVLPGRRAVVAGSGPFLPVVAAQLHAAGVEVVAVVEAARRRDMLRDGWGLLTHLPMLRDGVNSLRELGSLGIPLLWGHVVVEAEGNPELSRVIVAPCDRDGRPRSGRARALEADTLCSGHGFVPRAELAQLAGCRMKYVESSGGWIPQVDDHFATSVPGIWVAGDGGGIAGALVAELEGTLAGLAIAQHMGQPLDHTRSARRQSAAQQLAGLRRFRTALDRIYRVRPGLVDLARPDTLVCRCEELTRDEVQTGIDSGGTNLRSLKVITRLGMGPCQGRMCWPAVARMIAAQTGKAMREVGPASIRPPIQGLCVGDLLQDRSDDTSEPAVAGSTLDKGYS